MPPVRGPGQLPGPGRARNHLDLESREALIRALEEYTGTLIFVAHDRRLLAEAAQEVWAVGPEGLHVFSRGYEEYDEHRRVTLSECLVEKPTQVGKVSRQDEKERRRVEAERRNALSRKLKPLKAEYARAESELETVLTRQSDLEQILADPETYARSEEFTRLSKEYHEVEQQAERLMLRLEELEGEIGEVEEYALNT